MSYLLKVVALVCILAVNSVYSAPIIPFSYPLYKQCDPKWGNDEIIGATICQVGCLMSSISMSLAGKGIHVNGATANPGNLNTWLLANQGYTGDSELIESVLPNLNKAIDWVGPYIPGTALSMTDIQNLLDQRVTVILNVDNGDHFVLATGYDLSQPDVIFVNDPGFSRLSYTYSQVVGYRVFKMNL